MKLLLLTIIISITSGLVIGQTFEVTEVRRCDPPIGGWKGIIKGEVYWVDASVIFDRNK